MTDQPVRSRSDGFVVVGVLLTVGAMLLTSCANAPGKQPRLASSAHISSAQSGVDCSTKQPIAAHAIARPIAYRPCLVGKKVAGPAELVAPIASAGRQSCRHALVLYRLTRNGSRADNATRIDLCVSSTHAGIFATIHRRSVSPACATTGKIKATSIAVPALKSDCNLAGRLVVFKQAGVHVPKTGSTCTDVLGTNDEVQLCVMTDRFGTWATHHYYSRTS